MDVLCCSERKHGKVAKVFDMQKDAKRKSGQLDCCYSTSASGHHGVRRTICYYLPVHCLQAAKSTNGSLAGKNDMDRTTFHNIRRASCIYPVDTRHAWMCSPTLRQERQYRRFRFCLLSFCVVDIVDF